MPCAAAVVLLIGVASAALQAGPAGLGSVDDGARAAVEAARLELLTVPGTGCKGLLPADSRVDEVRWHGDVLNVFMTVPLAAEAYRSDLDLERMTETIAAWVGFDVHAGVEVFVRRSSDGSYEPLASLLPPAASAFRSRASRPCLLAEQNSGDASSVQSYRGGPVSQSFGQPSGALSGVVVFMTGGHGWTANQTDSVWELQRPVLLGMAEDYGNIDQLNYFANFCFNAGATVVPFRPVGWQPLEIVLDNDDPNVSFMGTWSAMSDVKYFENGVTQSGVAYRTAAAAMVEDAVARYTPDIQVTDYYPVYTFVIGGPDRVPQTYRIAHNGGVTEVVVDHRRVGNGWIWLGSYYLVAGEDNWVEISNASAEAGVVVADAIRWGCGVGDIVREGPGTISGYPRDHEAQRYWSEGTLGNNAVGFDSILWDVPELEDISDNVRAAAKWAREMNQEPNDLTFERWRRVYLEFHSNAGGSQRGQMTLITNLGGTLNQQNYALTLSDEFDADMTLLDGEFEHDWFDRQFPTLTAGYGAISAEATGDEFDATILEVAFHDNMQDAELLRDARFREASARAAMHGIIRFLNSLPDSQVPLAFLPDRPTSFRVEDLGGGDIHLAWTPPVADGARGDAATGYVIYQSDNGYGFGDPIVVGNVTSHVISNVPVEQTRYFRIAATNAGGESMPTEVLAVRRPAAGVADVVIVNGYDRQRRQINALEEFTQPAAYAGQFVERQIARRSNSFDYVVQHAEALAAAGEGFASCSNEAVQLSQVDLGDYAVAVWIFGQEAVEDQTLNSTERIKLEDFLLDGGAAFLSGAELAYDLDQSGGGRIFAEDRLRIDIYTEDANTYDVEPLAGGIFEGMVPFDFDPANGAVYAVKRSNVITSYPDSVESLEYAGIAFGAAAVEYAGPIYNTVVFAFPFETISEPVVRTEVMTRVVAFLRTAVGPLPFDFDRDGDVDLADANVFTFCFGGPGSTYAEPNPCLRLDDDGDADVDLGDYRKLQLSFTGPA
jgi:hypothetical protein